MSATTPIVPSVEPSRNPAVLRCCEASRRALLAAKSQGIEGYPLRELEVNAYRDAMPDLAGYENIRDFIACVTHGFVDSIISFSEAPKLLYAAQVALGALRHAPKEPKPAA